MKDILVKIQSTLPQAQKKVAQKLSRDEFIAIMQGITAFTSSIAGKSPSGFIDGALNLASYKINKPCRAFLESCLGSIKKWMAFGEKYKPLEDSSDLNFDNVKVDSVPDIMKTNLELNKGQLAVDLVCLIDENSKPSFTKQLEAEIESYFIVGSSRIDMIGKCMDIDNEIGGYNFDIPVLKDTARAVNEVKNSEEGSLSNTLKQTFTDNLLSTYRGLEQLFMEKLYELQKALAFRTLWNLDDTLNSFRRIASESALGIGRLNGIVELTEVFQRIKNIKSKAVACFTTNPYTTDVKKWTFDNTKNKEMFEKLATGTTTFSIDIRRSCKKCFNIRLLKLYIELYGTEEQPTKVPREIHLQIRRLSSSYFRTSDSTFKSYRQPLVGYRSLRFDRFTISGEAKCGKEQGKSTGYCVKEQDPRWISMCNNPLNKEGGLRADSLLGSLECRSPFGSYELKIPKDDDMICEEDNGITNTNCKDLDLSKFTSMNVWMTVFYWSGQYPKGPTDPICRGAIKRGKTAIKPHLLSKAKK
ncbi:uncharacterized protein [Porites lutea]|uniref:uncharacterized protein n=1 Tax=Porites lutea TaxID=51062 RepID=UPI003CC64F7A